MACELHSTAAEARATSADCVPAQQHNETVRRLDEERRARAVLELDLASARENIATLQESLARMKHHASVAASGTSDVESPRLQPYGREDSSIQVPVPSSAPMQREGSPLSSNDTKCGSKELLSDCSEFSSGMKKDSSKKKSKVASAPGSIRKTASKSKKERATKSKIPGQSRYWTPEEHKLFLEALNQFGHKDLRSISNYVGTRNMTQVRTHSQKYFMRLMREAKRQNPVGATAADGVEAKIAPGNASSEPGANDSPAAAAAAENKTVDLHTDKYSVPNTCGLTLLSLVGQDTLTN